MRTNARSIAAAALLAAVLLASGAAQAVTVAGWDFSQYAVSGYLSTDGSTTSDTLPANYSAYDPSDNAGPESANFGTLFFNGQFGSTNVDESSAAPGFVPFSGSLQSNLAPPGLLNGFDSLTLLLIEGQPFANELSMIAAESVDAVFRARLRGARGTGWRIDFGALRVEGGDAQIRIDYSLDGASYSPAVPSSVTVTAVDTLFSAQVPASVTTPSNRVFFRLSLESGTVIDNVSIDVTSGALSAAASKCLNGLNTNYSNLFAKAAGVAEKCSSDRASQKLLQPDVLACVAADPRQQIQKARLKNEDPIKGVDAKVCLLEDPKKGEIPSFGYSFDVAASDSSVISFAQTLQTALLGNDANLNLANAKSTNPLVKQTAVCQLGVQKAVNKLAAIRFKEFVACKKELTKTKPGVVVPPGVTNNPIISGDELEKCINFDFTAAKGRPSNLAKQAVKIADEVTKKCKGPKNPNATVDGFGSGSCAAAAAGSTAEFVTCASGLARTAAEQAIRLADRLF